MGSLIAYTDPLGLGLFNPEFIIVMFAIYQKSRLKALHALATPFF
jgi:hypothetical protein